MMDLERDNYVYPGRRFAKTGTVLGTGQGMTLRDYFAGQALAGICANTHENSPAGDWATSAEHAYAAADAMLAARDT